LLGRRRRFGARNRAPAPALARLARGLAFRRLLLRGFPGSSFLARLPRPGDFDGLALLAVLLLLLGGLHELEIRGLAPVAEAMADPEDARVAAGPLRIPGSDGAEQLARHLVAGDESRDVPARRDVPPLGERDQT